MANNTKSLGIVALAFVCGLAGCTATPSAGDPTLADTKSQVQLLRNDALDRIEKRFVAEIRPTTDHSVACLDEGDNPGGFVRQWRSSAEIVLTDDADLEYVTERLVQGFTGKGWDLETISDSPPFYLNQLTNDRSLATVEIGSDEHADGSVIRIITTGRCVTTAGPGSDEVTSLES